MKMKTLFCYIVGLLLACSCTQREGGHKVVLCIPVYGQSLALGEEAERMTNLDSLASYAGGRIVTERLDHDFGYFDTDALKQRAKRLLHYQKRSYELSVYTMAQRLADQTGDDTLICIFPGGQGATTLAYLNKGTTAYEKFMDDIKTACDQAKEHGWDFVVPAICWMQGESDIANYPDTDYRELLTGIWTDMNDDIRQLTGQQDTIRFVCYQPNALTRAERFQADSNPCLETTVPQTFVDLLRDDQRFWASGPTYPYDCVGERIHIDAAGQQHIGMLAARSVLNIIHKGQRLRGLIPLETSIEGRDVIVRCHVPTPPLTLDTTQVVRAANYGFSVVTQAGRNIVQNVTLRGDTIRIACAESPEDCQVRYAVNGTPQKSGRKSGPRGNLRDAADNWCYQFDIHIRKE